MTHFLIFLAVIGYGFYRWRKTKSETLLYAVILCILWEAFKHPFYLPLTFGLAILTFSWVGVLFYKLFYKKVARRLYIFSILLLFVGLMLFQQGIKSMGSRSDLLAFEQLSIDLNQAPILQDIPREKISPQENEYHNDPSSQGSELNKIRLAELDAVDHRS